MKFGGIVAVFGLKFDDFIACNHLIVWVRGDPRWVQELGLRRRVRVGVEVRVLGLGMTRACI